SCSGPITNQVAVVAAEVDPNLADNSATATNTVLDLTAPVIGACPANIVTSTDAGQCSKMNITWTDPTATDNCGATVACSPPSGSPFTKGTTTVTCTATDAAGNTNACTFTVTVNDTENPVMGSCPSDVSTSTDSGQCTVVVSFTVPSATDNC